MKKTYKERECKGCGKDFMPSSGSQIYCSECQELGYKQALRNAQIMEAATRRNFAVYYDIGMKVQQTPCKHCGKPIKYMARNREAKKLPDYCSDSCRVQARIEATKCAWCGKPMTETADMRDVKGHDWFCSDECQEAFAWDKARKEGTIKVCPVCGKEFLRKTGTFCSIECSREGQRRRPKPNRPKRPAMSEQERLQRSAECMKQKQDSIAKKKRHEEEIYIKENGLCPVCCVPYMDCERMSSEFRILPKGAMMYNDKIMACPKFKTTALKYLTQEDIKRISEATFGKKRT